MLVFTDKGQGAPHARRTKTVPLDLLYAVSCVGTRFLPGKREREGYLITATMTMTPSSRIRQRTTSHRVYLHPFLANVIYVCLECISPCWWIFCHLLCLSEPAQRRISVAVLACHFVNIDGSILTDSMSTWPAWLALFSFSSFISMRQEAAWATALIMLFILEAAVPLLLITCTSVLIWKQVTWTTGLMVMGALWIGLASLARWLRCSLYQSMGHE